MSNTRIEIVNAVSASMKAISTGSGSYTDFNDVKVWRVTAYNDNDFPAINIRDISDIQSVWTLPKRIKHSLTIEIEVAVSGNGTLNALREMISDVESAIGKDETFGGLALKTIPKKNELVSHQDKAKIGGALITIVVEYVTGRWKEN